MQCHSLCWKLQQQWCFHLIMCYSHSHHHAINHTLPHHNTLVMMDWLRNGVSDSGCLTSWICSTDFKKPISSSWNQHWKLTIFSCFLSLSLFLRVPSGSRHLSGVIGCVRSHSATGPCWPAHLEVADYYPWSQRVQKVWGGESQSQMGYGEKSTHTKSNSCSKKKKLAIGMKLN